MSNFKFLIVFSCWTLHDTLTRISSPIELDGLLCLSDYSRSHELIYLLVCFLNLRSKEILNLLLISCKSWGIWLSLLLCRKRPAWRWSLKLFCLSLSNSRLFSLRKRWLVWLNSKRDYASSNLYSLCHLWLEFNLALGEYQSSKLRQIIFKVETTILIIIFHESMTSRDWYVTHSYVAFVTSSKFKHFLVSVRHDQVDHPRRIFLEGQWL